MKIRHYILIVLLLCLENANAQVVQRAYTSIHVGYPKHWEVGTTFHGLGHFCIGSYYGMSAEKVGPRYHPNGGLFSLGRRLRNRYSSACFVAGVTTRTFKHVNCSLMAGPSLVVTREYENIVVTEIEYTNADKISYNTLLDHTVGAVVRFDVLGNFNKRVGMNLSLQAHLNSVHREYYVLLGVCFGVTGERYVEE